jgi:major membrane immunogen (membrane-anchored lipoprotein)
MWTITIFDHHVSIQAGGDELIKKTITILIVGLMMLCTGCNQTAQESQEITQLQDGYYMAIAAAYDPYGWKEYVTIYVNHDVSASVEFNARNSSGFVKSWDMDYMRQMSASDGTYPNEYSRSYVSALLDRQDPGRVDAITGATYSHKSFQLLAQAAIEKAKAGDIEVALVELPAME